MTDCICVVVIAFQMLGLLVLLKMQQKSRQKVCLYLGVNLIVLLVA